MNCKTLYRGPLDTKSLKKVSKKVLYAIAAAIFDNFSVISIRDRVILLLQPEYYQVADICDRLCLDDVVVVEQYPSSMFYVPYKCNFRVRFNSSRTYSTYLKYS